MGPHENITDFLVNATGHRSVGRTDERAHLVITCPKCRMPVTAGVIALTEDERVEWLRCSRCGIGMVKNDLTVSPTPLPGESVDGLPDSIANGHDEARKCFAVGALAACELVCRKLLMQVAVDKGAKEGASFESYVSYLADNGYVTAQMKPWVDQIRKHANEATHKLPSPDQVRADGTLAFTTLLLKLVYEMPHKMGEFVAPTDEELPES